MMKRTTRPGPLITNNANFKPPRVAAEGAENAFVRAAGASGMNVINGKYSRYTTF